MALRSVTIRDRASLAALRPAWDALLAGSATDEVTLKPCWLLPWWDVFGAQDGRTLASIAFYDRDRLVGLAPLLSRRFRYRPGIPFRRLELLATGESEADETCSDYVGIIAERGRERDVAAALASDLATGAAGRWDELVLGAMNGESPMPEALRDALAARRFHVELEERTRAPYVPLPATFEAYLAALKPNKRSQLKKSLRAFEAWAGGPPVIKRATTAAELEESKRVLVELHRERWSKEGSEGVFASPHFRAFHDRAMPELLAAGALELGFIEVRGERVCAFYNLRWRGKVSFYQSGRKLDVPDDIRVGVTMHAYLIRDAIADRMSEYDFLAGESQYKMALALATRPLVTLRAARPSVVEAARRAADRGTDALRAARERARRRAAGITDPRLRSFAEALVGKPRT